MLESKELQRCLDAMLKHGIDYGRQHRVYLSPSVLNKELGIHWGRTRERLWALQQIGCIKPSGWYRNSKNWREERCYAILKTEVS